MQIKVNPYYFDPDEPAFVKKLRMQFKDGNNLKELNNDDYIPSYIQNNGKY